MEDKESEKNENLSLPDFLPNWVLAFYCYFFLLFVFFTPVSLMGKQELDS